MSEDKQPILTVGKINFAQGASVLDVDAGHPAYRVPVFGPYSAEQIPECAHQKNHKPRPSIPAPKQKLDRLDNDELLGWARTRLKTLQSENLFGSITFVFENGRIVRTKTEKSEVPT